MSKILIGVTDCSKYDNYANWILAHSPDIEVVRLGARYAGVTEAVKCRGIVFTGGEDVHPRFYHKPEYMQYCHQDDVSQERDEYELAVMALTEKFNIPALGICRGLQLFNVFAGGTLIPDIPTWGKESHGKRADGSDFYHPVSLTRGSFLATTIGKTSGIINSNHHQSVQDVAPSLVVTALSDDGIVEGIERKDSTGKGFLCLVQWHPERMKDPEDDFSVKVRAEFVNAVTAIAGV